MIRLRSPATLVFALLVGCLTVGAAEKWIHARTEHFDMYSAATERVSRRYLNELEQFHSAFHQLFKFKPASGTRVTVIMFDSSSQFHPYKPVYKGRSRRVAGFYHHGANEDLIALSAEEQERGDGDDNVIFHEYVHRMLDEQGIKLPVWLNEGLAVFYSTMQVGRDAVVIGQPAQRRLNNLARSAMMSLEKLFAVTSASPEYNEESQSGVFYAQSWLLLHYLLCGTEQNIQGRLPDFIDALDDVPEVREARFQEIFGMSYSQMEIALRTYMSGGRFKVRTVELPVGDFESELRFTPVNDVERDIELENLRWRVRPDRFDPAALQRLTERAPGDPRPYEITAAVSLLRKSDRVQAEAYWKKAVEHGSDNAFVYLQLARSQIVPLIRAVDLNHRISDELCKPARRYLDRAVELTPTYREAWEAMAQLEAFAENPRVGLLEKIQSAARAMRNPANTLAALAVIRWRLGDYEACETLLKEVERVRPDATAENMVRQLTARLSQARDKSTESLRPVR